MFSFILHSILLGVALAMDSFSVSLADGLCEPQMPRRKQCLIASTFGFFQGFMPLIGWACVHYMVTRFRQFEPFIPWIALLLLLFIGGKMLIEGTTRNDTPPTGERLRGAILFFQGIATSIDALSVGFTIAHYKIIMALLCAMIIAVVTFIFSWAGLLIGRRFGTRLSGYASILGGTILIAIGLEIFFFT
ncbi:MAG: manganese efflux pump [Prevotella sp.]|nr:manganese efflux pump [Prevotella sp.]